PVADFWRGAGAAMARSGTAAEVGARRRAAFRLQASAELKVVFRMGANAAALLADFIGQTARASPAWVWTSSVGHAGGVGAFSAVQAAATVEYDRHVRGAVAAESAGEHEQKNEAIHRSSSVRNQRGLRRLGAP